MENPDIVQIILKAGQRLKEIEFQGFEIPRFSKRYRTVMDYLQSETFHNAKTPYQERILRQVKSHPEWTLADARGCSPTTGQTFEFINHEGHPFEVILLNKKEEDRLSHYLQAIEDYIETGDFSVLATFRGKALMTANGKRLVLTTDRRFIDTFIEEQKEEGTMSAKDLREQRRRNVLESAHPVCLLCGEDNIAVLRKAEAHHIAGHHEGEVITICRNCHAELTDKQQGWDKRAYRKPRDGFERSIGFFFGLADLLSVAEPLIRKHATDLLEEYVQERGVNHVHS